MPRSLALALACAALVSLHSTAFAQRPVEDAADFAGFLANRYAGDGQFTYLPRVVWTSSSTSIVPAAPPRVPPRSCFTAAATGPSRRRRRSRST